MWTRAPAVVIAILVPIALVASACFRTGGTCSAVLGASGCPAAGHPGDGSVGSAGAPTTTVAAPLVAATPPPTQGAPSLSGMVVVSGRVSVADGGLVAGVVVGFQHSDCPDCVRYTATTNPSGRYRVSLPEGRYRASCVPVGIRAYCLPVGASLDVTLDESISKVDFEIATPVQRPRPCRRPHRPATARHRPRFPGTRGRGSLPRSTGRPGEPPYPRRALDDGLLPRRWKPSRAEPRLVPVGRHRQLSAVRLSMISGRLRWRPDRRSQRRDHVCHRFHCHADGWASRVAGRSSDRIADPADPRLDTLFATSTSRANPTSRRMLAVRIVIPADFRARLTGAFRFNFADV